MPSQKVIDAIKLIKATQKSSSVYAPHLGEHINIKHLTAGQQERLVQSLIDSPSSQFKFNTTIIDIIKENVENGPALLKRLTMVDKYAIGLGLRVCSVSPILKTEVESEPNITYNIDLNQCITTIRNDIPKLEFDDIVVDDFVVSVSCPTMSQEYANEKFFKRDDNSFNITVDTVSSLVSNAFIGDASMFINKLTINQSIGDPLVIDFSSISLQDKLELVRKLPNNVLEKLLDPMTLVKNQIGKILKVVGSSEADNNIKRTIIMSFDASFFVGV